MKCHDLLLTCKTSQPHNHLFIRHTWRRKTKKRDTKETGCTERQEEVAHRVGIPPPSHSSRLWGCGGALWIHIDGVTTGCGIEQ